MKWREMKATGSYEGELERDRVYLESGEGKRREREALFLRAQELCSKYVEYGKGCMVF